MACEEARQMLDALMGGDRNAPLPRGAAVPSKKRKHQDGGSSNGHGGDGPGMLLLPGKRSKSCFDTDICPLYTAWGVDVYELFVNTKSDLGPNPYVADDGARQEYLKLGKSERDRLGFDYFLFEKLNQLVRSCDRIVHRNKEKLQQELNRKLSQRGGQDFVEDVDENQATGLATNMVQLEMLEEDLETKLGELSKMVEREEGKKRELEPLLDAQRKIQQQKQQAETGKMEEEQEGNGDGKVKEEDGDDVKVRKEEGGDEKVRKEDGDDGKVKKEDDGKVKKEEDGDDEQKRPENDASKVPELTEEEKEKLQSLQLDLGRLTLDRQRAIFQVGRIMTRLAPLYEAVETQRRNLNYVKSDISTDKTVCEVSGNFMSARDADERIAAHYAGKQYVGWKLVRDKLSGMIKQFGRYGPPPPNRSAPPPMDPSRGGGGHYHNRGGGGGGGGGDRWSRPSGGGSNSRGGRGRYEDDRGRGGPDRGGRWERHGPPGGDRRRSGGGWRR